MQRGDDYRCLKLRANQLKAGKESTTNLTIVNKERVKIILLGKGEN